MNPLRKYRILVVDADVDLAHVLKTMLAKMGFSDVHITRSGKEAISLLMTMQFDFIISEWNTQQLDGIKMLEFVRKNLDSPNRTIPVIMLTGRAEQVDVATARDCGVNEYVVKPFTAKSIYSRLQRIIEHPREFVVAKTFVGPDRRRGQPPEGVKERRVRKITPKISGSEIASNGDEPQVFLPDFSLKLKLGKNIRLGELITPDILEQSQAAINLIADSSLKWIGSNLGELKNLYDNMAENRDAASFSMLAADIASVALTINSLAGTFGYERAGEIAYNLYLFARNKLTIGKDSHSLVVKKHIEVLQVMFGNQMKGDAGEVGEKIIKDLRTLTGKFAV